VVQVVSFVAPKIIGGAAAPSPVGELGLIEMNQALEVVDVSFEQVLLY
jgi:diaminohydroxyphosphoribosylaminopyrimidine deaminase/5-amino-6-(5-phosphoribosylamino)uracil reductase